MGKPKKNWRTLPFWAAIKSFSAIKRILRPQKTSASKSVDESALTSLNRPHPLVSVLDSFDRKYWLMKHLSHVMDGGIVITDRYPAPADVGLDGPRIEATTPFTSWLAKMERENYASLPPPDLVFKMTAPLDVTLKRNAERDAPEPEEFVRLRYELAKKLYYPLSKVVDVNTKAPLDETVLSVKNLIWRLPK